VSVLLGVAELAAGDSPLWRAARLETPAGEARFAGRCPGRYLLGVEAILEGYLLHHGRARLFSQDDLDLALLAGDHLYAAGLAEICRTGDLAAVAALAELISRCAANQAEGRGADDEALWESTVAGLGAGAQPAR
jgi:hypothetical protein